jgi:hypothetical protein
MKQLDTFEIGLLVIIAISAIWFVIDTLIGVLLTKKDLSPSRENRMKISLYTAIGTEFVLLIKVFLLPLFNLPK